ncbi:MAG: ATP-binding protein [Pseudomonadota bacterium]
MSVIGEATTRLAEESRSGAEFFQSLCEILSFGLKCRWAAIFLADDGELSETSKPTSSLLASWDAMSSAPMEFMIATEVHDFFRDQSGSGEGQKFTNLAAKGYFGKLAPTGPKISRHMLLPGTAGQASAWMIALSENAIQDLPSARMFFQVAAQRAAGEYRRWQQKADVKVSAAERSRLANSFSAGQGTERLYPELFDEAPTSIRVEDFSQVKSALDKLANDLGIQDRKTLSDYLKAHPEFVAHCAKLIKAVDANKTAVKLHGFSDKQEFLKKVTMSHNEKALENVREGLLAMHVGVTQMEFETKVITSTGQKRDMLVRWTVPEGYEKTYARTLLTSIDITDINRTREELRQAQKMEAVGKLTGGIAHDFNNLLSVIQSNLDMIQARPEDARRIDAVQRAAKRAAELTSRLLSFSRKQALFPSAVVATEHVNLVLEMLGGTLGEGISVSIHAPDDLWKCHVDPSQLEVALLNLIINARDAMPGGGRLTVTLRNSVGTKISDGGEVGSLKNLYVAIAVQDTGTGMERDIQPLVFEPFFTTKSRGEGTGLGLSMVYGFAKQSGGDVSIVSQAGHGTTVTLYLPRALEGTEQDAEQAGRRDDIISDDMPSTIAVMGEVKSAVAPKSLHHVMLVEDRSDVLEVTTDALETLGFEVIPVTDGDMAVRVLEKGVDVDLLLSDLNLPGGKSGIELARDLQRQNHDMKVVIMAGQPIAGALQDEVSDFPVLRKPFSKQMLSQALDHALERS